MSKSIDLGHSMRELDNIVPASPRDVLYPDLHISECDDERLLDLPDEGTATIKFKVTRRHCSESTNGDSKKKRRTCSITLEIHSLEAPEKKTKKKTHWEMFNGV